MPEPSVPLIPQPGEVKMRLYGQGLGDCFLLAFPRENERPFYVVIDCGVGMNTPDEKDRMRAIVTDIKEATKGDGAKGNVDVLAVTHEHYDHLSGFMHSKDIWENEIDVHQLWLAWTEIENDPDAKSVQVERKKANDAAIKAIQRSLQMGDAGEDHAALRAEAGFLGVPLDTPFGVADFSIADAFDVAKKLSNNKVYCEPGDVLEMAGTDCRAYVLGPPRPKVVNEKKKQLIQLLEDPKEMYHYARYGITPDKGGSGPALTLDSKRRMDGVASALRTMESRQQGAERGDDEDYCAFDASLSMDWDEGLLTEFFWEHYTSADAWRRVDHDWLNGMADLALFAGDLTNNISLVLAFEMPKSKKILLFVGDAQVGNWLSWHQIGAWRNRSGTATIESKPDIKDLLGRVAFYKVGHHGSHNATVESKGLEMMPDGITAFIPVSVPVAQDILGYCPMPFYPVVRRLQEKTRGRVFLANGEPVQPIPTTLTEPELWQGVEKSKATLPSKVKAKKRGQAEDIILEGAVPLYLEITVPYGQ